MYGHPSKRDPYAERQPIPVYKPEPKVNGAAVWLLIVIPAGALSFAFGYAVGAVGWI